MASAGLRVGVQSRGQWQGQGWDWVGGYMEQLSPGGTGERSSPMEAWAGDAVGSGRAEQRAPLRRAGVGFHVVSRAREWGGCLCRRVREEQA